MDKLLKHTLDGDATGFIDRFKGMLQKAFNSKHEDITKEVAADLSGGTVTKENDEDPTDESVDLDEGSTEDAEKTLKAIIGFLTKNGEGKDAKEMLTMAKGIMDHKKKEGSFSPDQAKWIFNTSKAVLK